MIARWCGRRWSRTHCRGRCTYSRTSGRRRTWGHRGSLLLRCRALSFLPSMPVYPGALSPRAHPSPGRVRAAAVATPSGWAWSGAYKPLETPAERHTPPAIRLVLLARICAGGGPSLQAKGRPDRDQLGIRGDRRSDLAGQARRLLARIGALDQLEDGVGFIAVAVVGQDPPGTRRRQRRAWSSAALDSA